MSDRKEYTVTIGGLPHTMLLDSHDAKRLGGRAVEVKETRVVANKSRRPADKSAE